jgi:hypothetical protein
MICFSLFLFFCFSLFLFFCFSVFSCSAEQEELPTRKRSTIKALPICLPIHLKRFDLDYETFQTIKLNERFEFPLEINMFPYTLEGRRYYDARGGSPVVVLGGSNNNSSSNSSSTAENGGTGNGDESKTSGDKGGSSKNNGGGNDGGGGKDVLRQHSGGGAVDLMFVPEDAPHPKGKTLPFLCHSYAVLMPFLCRYWACFTFLLAVWCDLTFRVPLHNFYLSTPVNTCQHLRHF